MIEENNDSFCAAQTNNAIMRRFRNFSLMTGLSLKLLVNSSYARHHSPTLPDIPDEARPPLVDTLLEIILWQNQRIAVLEDEIHRLKHETRKPPPPPSRMEESTAPAEEAASPSAPKKPGPKRRKTAQLVIHAEQVMKPEESE